MLEALNTIDWSNVASCSYSLDEILVAIRGLASVNASMRESAFATLWVSLEHQGSVYEATALAVPFLLTLLADPQTPDKRDLVYLLVHLDCGGLYLANRYQDLPAQYYQRMAEKNDPIPFQVIRDLYKQWHDDTHRAFREGLPVFLPLLSDSDPAIREEIASLLAAFPEEHSMLLPPIIAQLQIEQNAYVQCSLLLSLGYFLPSTLDTSLLLCLYLEAEETPLLQFIAANALCAFLKDQTPEKAVQILLEVFVDPYTLQPLYERLSPVWGSGWIHARALYYLSLLTSSPHRTWIIERLIELFPTLDDHVDYDCADLLVRVAFYEKQFCFQPHYTFHDLDPLQQAVLRTLEAKEMTHVMNEENEFFGAEALSCMGFPGTRRGLQKFMATH
ncbi:HEAT repeat domain-containing protein [Dictyobacter kobayashii]|uniref:Uncharacterized protein n=1 Tax=Dictyobacter kobayashii TaxID=2014872 RepID=A0A402AP81_9CHLR|nr:HEAT repeat domain-containing protein [Dictyobacter kobayashii]GCE20902.1 hypothetical protein KDK_47020 [Dictyobacter kobayashii]